MNAFCHDCLQDVGKPIRGSGLMDASECRRKARYFLILSRQMSKPEDRAAMVKMAALWMGRADQAERIVKQQQQRQQQQTRPKKLPEVDGATS